MKTFHLHWKGHGKVIHLSLQSLFDDIVEISEDGGEFTVKIKEMEESELEKIQEFTGW